LPDSLSELTFPLLRQLTAPHQGFTSTMARPLDQDSEDEEKAVAVVEVNIEGVAITEEEEATIEMIDTTTEDLPHQVDTMIEVMIAMTNMTEIITVHHGTGRSLATMTTITETEIPGTITTGRGTGTTKTGTGGRTGTGTTGTGSQIGTTGHPETTMRGTGTMTGDMTDTLLHITTPVAAGDHLLLDLHHLGDQTIKESTK